MARSLTFTFLMLLGLLSNSLVAARQPYNQEEQLRKAQCDNDCFFTAFADGSFAKDPAAMCAQQKNRENYFCCMAEKCEPSVVTDSVQRQSLGCETRKMEFTFDLEAVCGIQLTTTSAAPQPTSAPGTEDYRFELLNIQSECDNSCFSGSFPGGSCTDDPACMCTQQKYRERYFCCMAEKCGSTVVTDSIERHHKNCGTRKIDFTFDVEGVCGIKLTTSTSAVSATATSPANINSNDSSAKSASTSPTSAPDGTTKTSSTAAIESNDALSKSASTSATEAPEDPTKTSSEASSEAISTESNAPTTNNAPQPKVMLKGVAIVIAASAMLLW